MKIYKIKNVLSLLALLITGFAFNCAAIVIPPEGIQYKESRLTDTATGSQVSFMDCEARLDGDRFELKNSKILRRWRINNGIFSPETMIDLDNDGVILNDTGDSDTGGNTLINFPEVFASNIEGSVVTLSGSVSLTGSPETSTIEIFRVDPDITGYGEGRTYIEKFSPTASGTRSWSSRSRLPCLRALPVPKPVLDP